MRENDLTGMRIVFGISGGIAAYKVLDFVDVLLSRGCVVDVIMTKHATKIVSVSEFEKKLGKNVFVELFDDSCDYKDYLDDAKKMEHIALADSADVFLVCPATANVVSKLAYGLADDLLTTSILATEASVVVCPAMNVKMWNHALTQRNIGCLRELGYHVVDPEYGDLACGYKGMGRLASFDTVLSTIAHVVSLRTRLKGKKVVVTSGPTSEEIDPVRVITNKSSGKMGASLADAAHVMGADVVLIRGRGSAKSSYHIDEREIVSVSDLFSCVKEEISDCDIFIHAAAVSDFYVKDTSDEKIKSDSDMYLELTPTTKILEKIKDLNKDVFLIGFKAENNVSYDVLVDRAHELLTSSRADFIVANDVGKRDCGFDVDTNEVFIVDVDMKVEHIGLSSKKDVAFKILDFVCSR